MRIRLFLGAAALALTAPATAAWQQASSKHFVIYGDMPSADMKAYATRLETFDAAARLIRAMPDPDLGDGNRLQVFLVSDLNAVGRLVGSNDYGIAGYFMGPVTGPVAVIPEKVRQKDHAYAKMTGENVFFHEYTHSLQLQNTNKPLPQWLSEGFAEFMGSPTFNADGSIGIGAPPTYRAAALFNGRQVPIGNLMSNKVDADYDMMAFYTQGWLMTHYLSLEPSRKGQIDRYVAAINKGIPPLDAARAAFGDLGELEKTLLTYRRQKNLPYLKIDASKLTIQPVTVTEMSPGAQAVMLSRIRLKAALSDPDSQLLERIRAVARAYPTDPIVLRTLAEAELRLKNYPEAVSASDRAIAVDPKSVEPIVTKGEALLEIAKKNRDAGTFKQARQQFLAGNHLDKEDPQPLYLYYRTFIDEGIPVTDGARNAVHYAATLAPQDPEVQVRSSIQYIRDGKLGDAKDGLASLAFSPHHNDGQRLAKDVYDLLAANKRDEAIALAEKKLVEFTEKKKKG
jgi:tetratricopeptide (TPR) repeat protein